MKHLSPQKAMFRQPVSNGRLTGEELANRQIKNFGISMLVLAVSIGLYYLGFFGSVDGPLNPVRLGNGLRSLGCTRTYLLFIFLGFLTISVIWNWIYNFFKGHLSATVHFQPVKKGIWGHTLWVAMLIVVCGIALYTV